MSRLVVDIHKRQRNFTVDRLNVLWLTDITEHPTREGKAYCCVVLDAFSRRVVGWAIDRRCQTTLVKTPCDGEQGKTDRALGQHIQMPHILAAYRPIRRRDRPARPTGIPPD